MSDRRTIRIFVSSPSDVRPERLIAEREFAYRFDVKAVLWEREPLLATSDFQTLIAPPSETDIVLIILWSRLGVVLAAPTVGRPSGRPVTGTEYEFEDAFAGFREKQLPDLLLYRKRAEITVKLGDRAVVEEQQRQSELVEDFMMRWTRDAEGAFTAAYWPFADGAEFEAKVEEHLRALLHKRVPGIPGLAAVPTVRWHGGSPFRGLQSFEPEPEHGPTRSPYA